MGAGDGFNFHTTTFSTPQHCVSCSSAAMNTVFPAASENTPYEGCFCGSVLISAICSRKGKHNASAASVFVA